MTQAAINFRAVPKKSDEPLTPTSFRLEAATLEALNRIKEHFHFQGNVDALRYAVHDVAGRLPRKRKALHAKETP